MDSQLYYCLNPSCPQPTARVQLKTASQHLHSSCLSWVVSTSKIAEVASTQYSFDSNRSLKFTTQPIETQEYLSQHQNTISQYMLSFSRTMRSELLSQFDQFDQLIRNSIQKLVSNRKQYIMLKDMSKQQGVRSTVKSLKLHQILAHSFPTYENLRLPEPKDINLIIQNLKNSFSRLWSLNSINMGENQQKPTLKQEQQEMQEESVESTQSIICLDLNDLSKKVKKDVQDVWKYAVKECNLKTAQILMGQSQHKFYSHEEETKTGKLSCCYCQFTMEAKVPKKTVGNSTCAYAILEHICTNHPIIARQNYDLLKNRITCVSLSQFLKSIHSSEITSVGLMDSFSLGRARRMEMVSTDVTVELSYNQNRPLYCNTFVRGGQPREAMALFGYLSCYFGVFLQKKLTIYTSNHKKDALVDFLAYYEIPHVTVVSSPEPLYEKRSASKASFSTPPKKSPFL